MANWEQLCCLSEIHQQHQNNSSEQNVSLGGSRRENSPPLARLDGTSQTPTSSSRHSITAKQYPQLHRPVHVTASRRSNINALDVTAYFQCQFVCRLLVNVDHFLLYLTNNYTVYLPKLHSSLTPAMFVTCMLQFCFVSFTISFAFGCCLPAWSICRLFPSSESFCVCSHLPFLQRCRFILRNVRM